MELNKFRNKNILILGFGREGKSTYEFFLKNNIIVTIADSNMDAVVEYLSIARDTKTVLDYGYLDNIDEYDYIFKTPGLPGFKLKGIDRDKVYSQTRLFIELKGDRTIGITGTKGKSTTSSLLNHVLSKYKNSVLVGNIGIPALDAIDTDYDYYIYEMSSFQTEFLGEGPKISIVLNLFEEHLNNYESYDAYIESKLNIFDNINIYGCDNSELRSRVEKNYLAFGEFENNKLGSDGFFIEGDSIVRVKDGQKEVIADKKFDRKLIGEHNLINMLVVFIVMDILNIEFNIKDLSEFSGLNHRLQLVYKRDDLTFYDDSISTIPASCINALESIKDAKCVIVGGFDRNIDYKPLIEYLNKRDIFVVCLPDTGHKIYDELNCNKYRAEDMCSAVRKCIKETKKGAIVLSPAAPSYNFYKNFEERGDHFLYEVIKNFK